MKAKEMQLGDVIRLNNLPFSDCIVKNIECDKVHLYRPYGVSENFSYTGGVICFVGIEEFTIPLTMDGDYELLDRKEIK